MRVLYYSDLNNVPSFTNLPSTISVNENTASGTILYTLTSYDADAGATLSYTMTVTPAADAGKFTFATNSKYSLFISFFFLKMSPHSVNSTFRTFCKSSEPYI
jgi:hypothetical protein